MKIIDQPNKVKNINTVNYKLKILIVCSINSGKIAPFISDQVEALKYSGLECDYFTIHGKGIKGYLKQRLPLLAKIKSFQPDIIHAHYGLSGLLANTQRSVPVITTYHGSDINLPGVFVFSRIAMFLSAYNIFVSQKNIDKSRQKHNFALIPCGVDTSLFFPKDKQEARRYFGFSANEKLVLFAGHFQNAVKNPELALSAVSLIPGVRLLELKGYTRQEVALLMNAVDACLMTSHTEGSPQFIKEAIACGCPVISVDVGDVKELIQDIEGCSIVERNAGAISKALQHIMNNPIRIDAKTILEAKELTQSKVVNKILQIYSKVLHRHSIQF